MPEKHFAVAKLRYRTLSGNFAGNDGAELLAFYDLAPLGMRSYLWSKKFAGEDALEVEIFPWLGKAKFDHIPE